MSDSYITPKLFNFLSELKENNNKEWFESNKARYESDVREPLLRFVTDFGVRLAEVSPHFVADARKSGGSLFRIYRDVRFSKDKTPYKTNAGLQLRHESGKDVHAPGFYLHLQPNEVFIGVGIWHPDNTTLGKIRDAIVETLKSGKLRSQTANLRVAIVSPATRSNVPQKVTMQTIRLSTTSSVRTLSP